MFGTFSLPPTRVVVLGIALLFCSALFAQEQLLPVFHFNRLTTADGLPTNGIRSRVVRDNKGFVWIGTFNGLARYDGYGCRVYRNDPNDPASISSNTVMSLLLDRKQRLWVGTWETGLSLYDPARDRFINFLPRPGDSSWLQGKTVVAILEDRSGNIWLGTLLDGLVRIEMPVDM